LMQYQYDVDGRRVQKATGSAATVYVYDAFGQLAAEYTNGSAGTPPCTTCFLSTDHLGNTRLVTDGSANVIARHDFTPFGEEIPAGYGGRGSEWGKYDAVNQKFTGQEHDSETQFDFFGARYFSSAQGRFTSPDEPLADQFANDPQSWNLYSYVRNNPLRYVDPSGMSCIGLDDGTQADDGDGLGCSAAGVRAGNPFDSSTLNQGQTDAQVTGQGGNWLGAFGLNLAFALDNIANSFFSFIAPDSQLLSQTPTNREFTGQLATGIAIAGTALIGPGGEAGQVAQIGRKLDYLLGLAKGNAHNVLRSQNMASALNKIGIYDSAGMRQYLAGHLNQVLNDANHYCEPSGRDRNT
jgi:RHS repeat-associated protein